MTRGSGDGTETWWNANKSGWLEDTFAFWIEVREPPPAREVKFQYTGPFLAESRFPAWEGRVGPIQKPQRKKAALIRATGLVSDAPQILLECSQHSWEFSLSVESAFEEFRTTYPDVSAFGREGSDPWPANLGVHGIIETSDNWLLLGLRSKKAHNIAHSNLTWSASFEETVESGIPRDEGLMSTIERGVGQEYGIAPRAVSEARVLAIGRECSRQPHGGRPFGSVVIVSVRIRRRLEAVWRGLTTRFTEIPDIIEHDDFMAVRFRDPAREVVRLIEATDPRSETGVGPHLLRELGIEHSVHEPVTRLQERPEGFGWNPTSRSRLLLWLLAR